MLSLILFLLTVFIFGGGLAVTLMMLAAGHLIFHGSEWWHIPLGVVIAAVTNWTVTRLDN